jgi:4a-hydroxytetrahydrobiopterin dehydratase
MRDALDDEALRSALAELPDWTGDPTGLRREATLPSFRAAIEVVDRVADAAEELDHHPDIDIRWRTLRFACSTHAAGGAVTELDVRLARQIDAVVTEVAGRAGGGSPEPS